MIADYLTRNGIGVLRFDDRGVGESKGDLLHATTESFAGDVSAAVDYLKTRKDINPKKIGLIGHSEGGAVAPMVAANNKDINSIVLLAGTGIPGDQLLLLQTYLAGKAAGMTEPELADARKTNLQVYDILKNEKDAVKAKKELVEILQKSYADVPASQKPPQAQIDAMVSQQADDMLQPWMPYFLKYDPATSLRNVKCPVLVLNGGKDFQVPPKENTEAIKNTLEKAGNKKVTVKIFPNLNHLFQESITGNLDEYEKIEQTFSPDALKFMSDWLNAKFK
ncbi:alpha/beta hydrolase family protein [Flavobacterium sp. 3HN19-14]|uniref:alpha/beta hydrolase family protein n=1 Tax=Flavobacterium sp. 3HN19-14 TaxID=3448133 RepID=UPI003EE08465